MQNNLRAEQLNQKQTISDNKTIILKIQKDKQTNGTVGKAKKNGSN